VLKITPPRPLEAMLIVSFSLAPLAARIMATRAAQRRLASRAGGVEGAGPRS
jgi:hypothetical protein